MGNKALLTWNIRPKSDLREHLQRIREFVGKLPALGLELQDAWYTIYGDAPHILLGIVAHGRQEEQLESALASEEWSQMLAELKRHITGYRQRIVKEANHFQF